jgi:hypothetical protein
MASGTGGQIALAKASSLYHVINSADLWTDFVTESIEHTLNELEEGSITGNKDAPPSHKGIDFGQGGITIEPKPDALGNFMRGVFGQASGSVLIEATSTGANSSAYGAGNPTIQHTFLPIQTAVADQNFLPAYTTMVYKDVGSAFFFQGCQYHGIEFNITAGQLHTVNMTLMARSVNRNARITGIQNLTSKIGTKPWVWDMASIQVSSGLTTGFNSMFANTNYEGVTLNLNVPIEGVVLLDGNKNYAEFQVNEFRRININGTISFRNQEEYDAFVAYENRSFRATLTNQSSQMLMSNPDSLYWPTLEIDVPQMKYLSWSTPIGGPNRLISTFTAKAERDTASAYMTEARLINITSAY